MDLGDGYLCYGYGKFLFGIYDWFLLVLCRLFLVDLLWGFKFVKVYVVLRIIDVLFCLIICMLLYLKINDEIKYMNEIC